MARFMKIRTSDYSFKGDTDVRLDLDRIVAYQAFEFSQMISIDLDDGTTFHVPYSEKLIAYLDRELRVKDIENVDTRTDAEYFAEEG